MRKISTLLTLLLAMSSLQLSKAMAQELAKPPLDLSQFETVYRYSNLDRQLRFAIDGGYSHRLGRAADNSDADFVKKIRRGFNVGAELSYFPVQKWGVGAKFKARMFRAEKGMVKDRVNIFFVAPLGQARIFDRRNENAWVFGFSAGYLLFKEKVTNIYRSETVDEGGFGISFEIGYDIRLSYRTFIGLKAGLTAGSVRLETSPGKNERENASSLDFSVGLRF